MTIQTVTKGYQKYTLKYAHTLGKVSIKNSKMPGSTYAQDSFACHIGAKLATVKGSTCFGCYARRLAKMRPSVRTGHEDNLSKWRYALSRGIVGVSDWVDSMVFQIQKAYEKTGEPYHRWFDSGDLDSADQLLAILEVAYRMPHISFWLPTRETGILKSIEYELLPVNLVIRVSSVMVNDAPIHKYALTSTVHTKGSVVHGQECLAYTRGNECGDCRACWHTSVSNVSYKKH
jgi:hypothetical protein